MRRALLNDARRRLITTGTSRFNSMMIRTMSVKVTSLANTEPLNHNNNNSNGSSKFNLRGQFRSGKAAYLDTSSTTPLDPRVLDAMLPYMIGSYGNPHSRTHIYGWEAEHVVEHARQSIANLIHADDAKEIIFTSGATESNNLAIKGSAHFYQKRGKHLITTQTEHKCVLDSFRNLEQKEGYEVTYLPVQAATGRIDLNQLKEAIRPDTILCSVMAVNNEIGTLQPLQEIGALCRQNKIVFHCDAAQMLGKLPIHVNDLQIDLMSMSSHKVYGPKGIGALYVRRRPRVRLEPLLSGGGQERGLRSGTLPHFLCAGFGHACALAQQEMEFDTQWITYLSNKLQKGIETTIPAVVRNGDPEHNYNGCLNYSFAYVEGESLLMALKNIAVSSGSACTSASLEPSYVLRALGVDDELAHSSLRFGIGRFTTEEEIDFCLELLQKHVERLREMSPLWEMVQEGIDLKTIQWTQDATDGHH
ncbi:cysteine desulfurase [Fistulifera solaris]|uniref:cysteine desulfurase n=1 Tax=Fistulifera solaris TaxID=1519565 RepID=A0A1Z5KA33_FISSO|nr:cysteine desulfurase [Fistulifera solaris]|eukprot:GAX23130.1 cysteine desulfurase [Fistulifera solaris]